MDNAVQKMRARSSILRNILKNERFRIENIKSLSDTSEALFRKLDKCMKGSDARVAEVSPLALVCAALERRIKLLVDEIVSHDQQLHDLSSEWSEILQSKEAFGSHISEIHNFLAVLESVFSNETERVVELERLLEVVRAEISKNQLLNSEPRCEPFVNDDDIANVEHTILTVTMEHAILKREIASMHIELESLERENVNLRSTIDEQQRDFGKTLSARKDEAKKQVESLREQFKSIESDQNAYLRAYAARCIAASVSGDALSQTMVDRILSSADAERMSEAMALLKSTSVHFDPDIKKMRSIQRLTEAEQESVFKSGHNEVKILVSMCISKENSKRFQRGGHTGDCWPLTQQLLKEKFPSHKLETINSALQDMVIAWDGLSKEAKARLMTAQDVVANSHLLFMIASYVTSKRAVKWASKYQGVSLKGTQILVS